MKDCNPAVNYLKKQIFGFVWTFCVNLNFDQIDSNKVIIFCVKTGAKLEYCLPPGSLTIVDAYKENLLFRKQIIMQSDNFKVVLLLSSDG